MPSPRAHHSLLILCLFAFLLLPRSAAVCDVLPFCVVQFSFLSLSSSSVMRVLLACVVILAMVCSASAIQHIGYENADCTGRSQAILTVEPGVCVAEEGTTMHSTYTCVGDTIVQKRFTTAGDSTCTGTNSTLDPYPTTCDGTHFRWSCENVASASSITVSAVMVAALAAVAAFIKF